MGFYFQGSFLNNLLNRTLRNSQVDLNADGDPRQLDSKLRDVKEVFPLMKEVDCPYQAARWPMECQVRKITIKYIINLITTKHCKFNDPRIILL